MFNAGGDRGRVECDLIPADLRRNRRHTLLLANRCIALISTSLTPHKRRRLVNSCMLPIPTYSDQQQSYDRDQQQQQNDGDSDNIHNRSFSSVASCLDHLKMASHGAMARVEVAAAEVAAAEHELTSLRASAAAAVVGVGCHARSEVAKTSNFKFQYSV